jgi:uncharacterized protein (TIGR00296 family)
MPALVSYICPYFAGRDYELRGCIGSLSPQPIVQLYAFAQKSAFEDTRFDPLQYEEMSSLQIGVSLLVNYEVALHAEDWVPGVHGIIIDFRVGGKKYSATYLPEVAEEQGWSQSEALQSLAKKAGYPEKLTSALKASMSVTRYQSSKHALTYAEWDAMRNKRAE